MAGAVLVSVALQLSLPDRHVLSPSVLFPSVEVLLLVVLVVGDPGRIDRRSAALKRLTAALVIVMTVDNFQESRSWFGASSMGRTATTARSCWPQEGRSG